MSKDEKGALGRGFLLAGGVVTALGGLCMATPAFAQTETESFEEIIVTAQKRDENLSDVPLSVTAASAETLRDFGVTEVAQLERLVPGFTYQLSTFGVPVYTLRGVGFYERSVGSSPAVSIYSDQVPLTYAVMTTGVSLDLERVEVLKGPQGTLFGQNATGGAINYIAARPTEAFEAGGDLSLGSFGAIDANGYVSGALGENARARLALRRNIQDDWQESFTSNDENGARDFSAGRLLIDWEPTSSLSLQFGLSSWIDRSETQAGQFVAFRPSRSCTAGGLPAPCAALNGNPQGYPIPPREARYADWDRGRNLERDDEFLQFALRADWRLGETTTLTSITAQTEFTQRMPVDPDGTNYKDYSNIIDSDIGLTFQELRLSGEFGDRAQWMIGANYQDEHADELLNLDFAATNASVGPFLYERAIFVNLQSSETAGAFASLDYNLTDRLTARASARYTTYTRDFEGGMRDPGDGAFAAGFTFLSDIVLGGPTLVIPPGGYVTLTSPTNPAPVSNGVRNTLEEDNVAFRVGLDWRPSEETMFYANIARGYKSGSFPTIPGVFASQYRPVTQESLVAYEAGVKTLLADGLVRLNAAAFYYDYQDKQILGTTLFPVFGPLPILVNIPESHIQGIEFDVAVRPTAGLELSASATYVNSEIDQDPTDPRDPFGVSTTFVGEQFPSTPEWQFVLAANYEFPIGEAFLGFVGANYNYRTETNASLGEEQLHRIDAYGLLDLRAGFGPESGDWRLSVWGRNVADEYYWNNVARAIDTVTRYAGMPATYGVALTFNYQ
ncbi:MAG: TonB-dependent receptor [Caulobacterales bacterium]